MKSNGFNWNQIDSNVIELNQIDSNKFKWIEMDSMILNGFKWYQKWSELQKYTKKYQSRLTDTDETDNNRSLTESCTLKVKNLNLIWL